MLNQDWYKLLVHDVNVMPLPRGALVAGWIITAATLIWIPGYGVYALIVTAGSLKQVGPSLSYQGCYILKDEGLKD